MKRTLHSIAVLFCMAFVGNAFAQTQIIWTDSLIQNTAATSTQNAAWTAFRALLTPRTYTKVIIKGTFDPVGQSCTDTSVATGLANSLYTNTDYISPSACNGNVWHNCATHNFEGEVWLNPSTACDNSNCPFGYILRPNINVTNPGNGNWGGVNTNTCSGPNQRMTLIFEYGNVTAVTELIVPEIGLEVFPNPFSNSFSVSVSNIESAELIVTNVFGQLVFTDKISSGTINIATGNLASGIYFVTVRSNGNSISKKIIKASNY